MQIDDRSLDSTYDVVEVYGKERAFYNAKDNKVGIVYIRRVNALFIEVVERTSQKGKPKRMYELCPKGTMGELNPKEERGVIWLGEL